MSDLSRTDRTLNDWLEHIQSIHRRTIDLQLDRVRRVLHRMSYVRPNWVVTVGGTNGKGTTIAVLESIYRRAGYRVGAYTSPHLVSYCERFRIDGEQIDQTHLLAAFVEVENARSDISLTYFEYTTLAALSLFQSAGIELALLEVGLGGRADAVNAINPDIVCITSIALDHEAWLGNNREQIGREKAGIMRFRGRVVVNDPDPPCSILDRSSLLGCEVRQVGADYTYATAMQEWSWQVNSDSWVDGRSYKHLPLPNIPGPLREHHAAAALAVIESMQTEIPVSERSIQSGLMRIRLRGRIQVFEGAVEQILDVAHNPAAVTNLVAYLGQRRSVVRAHAVFSMLRDKDIASVVKVIDPLIDCWHLSELDGDRGMSMDELHDAVTTYGSREVLRYSDPISAYRGALCHANPGERLVVFGSFQLVGAILSFTDSDSSTGSNG